MTAAPDAKGQDLKKISLVTALIVIVLGGATVAAYRYAKKRPGSTVLPGGITYLGPVSERKPNEPKKFSVAPNTPWTQYEGKRFPYTFSYPTTLALGIFPNDPFDAVTVFWGNTDARLNLLLRVEDLNNVTGGKPYINQSKKVYAENWWKQYNWKGVKSVEEFTNTRGLKGYRAKYLDPNNQTPFDNIFFEVPNRPDLVIWMASPIIEPSVFDRIVDSVAWSPKPNLPIPVSK